MDHAERIKHLALAVKALYEAAPLAPLERQKTRLEQVAEDLLNDIFTLRDKEISGDEE